MWSANATSSSGRSAVHDRYRLTRGAGARMRASNCKPKPDFVIPRFAAKSRTCVPDSVSSEVRSVSKRSRLTSARTTYDDREGRIA
jgi:hypothetical protein